MKTTISKNLDEFHKPQVALKSIQYDYTNPNNILLRNTYIFFKFKRKV